MTTIHIGRALNGKYLRGDEQTLVAVSLIQDVTLSGTARGLIVAIIVGPEKGPVTLEWLLAGGPDSPETVRAALAELESRDLIEVTR